MLKEYIQNIQSENDRKIGSLEKEMNDLVSDLACAEKMMEELEREKKLDTNIFSPRAMNQKIDDNIVKKQEEIRQLKQRMEYVTQMIEDGLQNREEYRKLEEELSEEKNRSEEESSGADDLAYPGDTTDVNVICVKDQISDEKDNNNENNINEICQNIGVEQSSSMVNKDELMSFLNTVYHKTETSLAFLNGNKNRARSELKSCMKLVKDFAQKVENG